MLEIFKRKPKELTGTSATMKRLEKNTNDREAEVQVNARSINFKNIRLELSA